MIDATSNAGDFARAQRVIPWDPAPAGLLGCSLYVPHFREQLAEPDFPVLQWRRGDGSGQFYALFLRNAVQYRDRSAITEQDPLGVNGDRIFHHTSSE